MDPCERCKLLIVSETLGYLIGWSRLLLGKDWLDEKAISFDVVERCDAEWLR
jgi:hypothetical protein